MAVLTMHMFAPRSCGDCHLHGIDPWRCVAFEHDGSEPPGYYIERGRALPPHETPLKAHIWRLTIAGELVESDDDPARPF